MEAWNNFTNLCYLLFISILFLYWHRRWMSLTCWSTQEISKPSVCLQTSSFGSLLRSPSPDSLCICLSLQFEGSYNHVNPSQEEVDEGFQEAPARSTCWHQWGSSGQQHHAMECCHFWVFLSFSLSFFF